MSTAEKYLPFILALLAPGLGVLNDPTRLQGEWQDLLLKYVIVSVAMVFFWFYNRFLINSRHWIKDKLGKYPFLILANGLAVALFCFADYYLNENGLTAELGLSVVMLRFSILVLIFNVVLMVFAAQRTKSDLELQNLSLQAENLKFQVETLKQQINPHFLFNSLNTLLDLIEEDTKAASSYVRHFASLYRGVLQSAKYDFIPLRDEFKFLDDYWSLLKVRFKDAIVLSVKIPDEKMEYLIPPLSLQFLIENAVKHNEVSKRAPLLVEVMEKDDHLMVRNGIRMKESFTQGEGVGLRNLQQRFTMLYKPIEYGIVDNFYQVKLPLKINEFGRKG